MNITKCMTISATSCRIYDATFSGNGQKVYLRSFYGRVGALVLALRNPDEYVSVSAFRPLSPHRKYRGDSKPLPHIL